MIDVELALSIAAGILLAAAGGLIVGGVAFLILLAYETVTDEWLRFRVRRRARRRER